MAQVQYFQDLDVLIMWVNLNLDRDNPANYKQSIMSTNKKLKNKID